MCIALNAHKSTHTAARRQVAAIAVMAKVHFLAFEFESIYSNIDVTFAFFLLLLILLLNGRVSFFFDFASHSVCHENKNNSIFAHDYFANGMNIVSLFRSFSYLQFMLNLRPERIENRKTEFSFCSLCLSSRFELLLTQYENLLRFFILC